MKVKTTANNETNGDIQDVESMNKACRTASNIVKGKNINFIVVTKMEKCNE